MILAFQEYDMTFQEYDFIITYHKDSENQNVDALSRQFEHHSAVTAVYLQFTEDLKLHQRQDKVICQLYTALLHHPRPPRTQEWCCSPLKHYHQLWSQLLIKEDLVCRQYTPGPASEPLTVPIIPTSYQSALLLQYHDHPQAGPPKARQNCCENPSSWVLGRYAT